MMDEDERRKQYERGRRNEKILMVAAVIASGIRSRSGDWNCQAVASAAIADALEIVAQIEALP